MSDRLALLQERMHISPAYAASVGYFLFAFAEVESETDRAIWAILGLTGKRGGHEITTAIRDFGQRMLLLTKLSNARLASPEARADCAKVVSAISFLNARRVDLVHSAHIVWAPDTENTVLSRMVSERDYVRHVTANYSTDYLCELAHYAATTAEATRLFWLSIRRGPGQPLPSLDKRPTPPSPTIP